VFFWFAFKLVLYGFNGFGSICQKSLHQLETGITSCLKTE